VQGIAGALAIRLFQPLDPLLETFERAVTFF
jgi:hypothetical protein